MPGNSSVYTLGYSVDFTTLAAQNLLTGGSGAKTIDGKTWTLENAANATTAYINDGTHAGLYLRSNSTSSYIDAGTYTAPSLHTSFKNLVSAIAPGQYESAWVLFQFTMPHTPDAFFNAAQMGITSSLAGFTSTNRATLILYRAFNPYDSSNLQYTASHYISGATQSASNNYVSPNVAHDVFAVRFTTSGMVELYWGDSVAGAFPALSALVFFTRFMTAGYSIERIDWSGWDVLAAISSYNTAGNTDLLLSKLAVYYK